MADQVVLQILKRFAANEELTIDEQRKLAQRRKKLQKTTLKSDESIALAYYDPSFTAQAIKALREKKKGTRNG